MNDHARIRKLCNRYLSGRMTAAELESFLRYLHEETDHPLLQQEMMRMLQEQDYPDSMEAGEHQALEDAILKRIGQEQPQSAGTHPLLKHGRRIWITAATLAAVIALGAYLWQAGSPEPAASGMTAATQNLVSPGGNKAILTLADGSHIILDSLQDGSVVTEGGIRVTKTGTGAIAYGSTRATVAATPPYNTLTTPVGGQYRLRLPDGTGVWLNAASSIRYPVAFTGGERRVAITGEVYFEVAADRRRPFIVTHDNLEVHVLGTDFNLNTYSDEQLLKVTLVAGSIRVTETGTSHSTLVRPGEQARLDADGHLTLDSDIDVGEAIAWKNGLFSFSGTDIYEVMHQITRWYGVEVQYEGRISKQFYGKIARTADITDVLKMLQMTEGARFILKGKQILVMPYEK